MRAAVPGVLLATLLLAAAPARAEKWVTSWVSSDQGPYPAGVPALQPDLAFAFPTPEAGARDQTFRIVLTPEVWGRQMRVRFSNVFGTRPVTFDGASLGLQASGAALMPGSNRPVTFGGKKTVTVAPGDLVWSDPVSVPWAGRANAPEMLGRRVSVSFHVAGESGPATWHAKAMQTSYMTVPGAGALGELEDESAFANSTTSTFFVDALDVMAANDTRVVLCLGDSITDGTGSTLNGHDRWPDVLARRLRQDGAGGSVLDAGISGNQVLGPADYRTDRPAVGGPSALARLDRDVLSLSGVTHVVVLEGINDLGTAGGRTAAQLEDGLRQAVTQIRAKLPGVKVIGGTMTGILGTTAPALQDPSAEVRRREVNAFLRGEKGLFDGIVDFDRATADPATGALRAEFVPSSTDGGKGDKLHPNRAGYLAMADAVDLRLLAAPPPPKPRPKPKPKPKPESDDGTPR